MGDLAAGHSCDVFIYTFADDLVAKYRSPFLDEVFGDRVRYYVMADDSFQVGLYAAVKAGKTTTDGKAEEEHFRLERMRLFYPPADDIAAATAEELELSEEEVQRRLEKGEADMEREEREYNEQIERQISEDLEEDEEDEG